MSELKLCQGTNCHTYHTKDRIRGSQGDKHYETRRRSQFYYGNGNFCSWNCLKDWNSKFMELALSHFGRLREPKRQDCRNAWYKDYTYNYDHTNNRSNNIHYIVNDLIGKKIPITEQQYDDVNYKLPLNIS
tara:strand:+ start:66 stop:458 length:393 start_codon:yes stop_codon:yes gene_type:complete